MNFSKSQILAAVIATLVVLAPAARPAHADTYQIYDLGTGYRRTPLVSPYGAITATGTVVIYEAGFDCGGGPLSSCFQTIVNGAVVSQSPTDPGLVYDDGTPCTIQPAALMANVMVAGCNNGHEVYGADRYAPSPYMDTIFDGPSLTTDQVASGFELNELLLNSSGDFVFVANEAFGDGEIYEAVDLSTPEPASILLLGTGLLAVLGAVRYRLVAAR